MRLNILHRHWRNELLVEQGAANAGNVSTGSTHAADNATAGRPVSEPDLGTTGDIGLDTPVEPMPDFTDADRKDPKPVVATDDSLITEPVIWTRIRSRLKARHLIDNRHRHKYPVQLDEDNMTEEQLLMNAVGIIEALPDSIKARYRRRKPRVPGPVIPSPERQVALGRKSRPKRISETDIDVSATSGLGGINTVTNPENLGAYSSLYTPSTQDADADTDGSYPVPDDQADYNQPEPAVTTTLADVIGSVGDAVASVGRLLGGNKDTIERQYTDEPEVIAEPDLDTADPDTDDLPATSRDTDGRTAEFSVDEDDLPPTEAFVEPDWLATIAETVGPLP